MSSRLSWFVFFALVLCYGYFFPRWGDWNENSRLDQVLAIVDQHTLAIDRYYQNTGDFASYNGHYYSDKAPGTAFLGVPAYWLFKTFFSGTLNEEVLSRLANYGALATTLDQAGTGLLADKIYYFGALVFVTFLVVAVPSALLGVLFYRMLAYFTTDEFNKLALTLSFGLATPAFAYANNLYGHQVAAVLLFAAFYKLFQTADKEAAGSAEAYTRMFAAVGFLLSLSVITEYPSALIAAGITVYGLYKFRNWRAAAWLVAGGSVPALLAAGYNLIAFGSPFSLGYSYSTLWQATHSVGLMSLTLPTLDAIWGITFSSYRGLFFLSPFLLLALPGLRLWARDGKHRGEFWLMVWSIVSFFLFNSASVMWSGGFSIGPRYLVPMLPFLALPIIFFLDQNTSRWARVVAWLTVIWSALVVWAETVGGQAFPQFEPAPLWQYSLPRLATGNIARNVGMLFGLEHWASLAPLFVLGAIAAIFALRQYPTRTSQPAPVTTSQFVLPSDRDI